MEETGGTYKLVRSAVIGGRPVAASYRGRHRLLCLHRLGWNRKKHSRLLYYLYGGDGERGLAPAGSPANWRCMAVDELGEVKLLGRRLAHGSELLTAANLYRKPMWMPKINRIAIRRRDSERVDGAGTGQS
jgi:hypothetical protein